MAVIKKVKDYYKILGIERTASAEDIRYAYRKLVRKYHPDLNPDDPEALELFKEINEAYKVLGNLDNRLYYSMILNRKKQLMKEVDKFENGELKK